MPHLKITLTLQQETRFFPFHSIKYMDSFRPKVQYNQLIANRPSPTPHTFYKQMLSQWSQEFPSLPQKGNIHGNSVTSKLHPLQWQLTTKGSQSFW